MNYYQKKFLINIGVILIAFSAMIIFIIYPAVSEITGINREITQEKKELEQKLQMGMNLKKIKTELEEVKKSSSSLDQIFIKAGGELEFITQIENLASSQGVKINISPDFTGQDFGGGITKIPLEIDASGKYPSILKFLSALESLPYYLNADSIVVYSTKNTADSQEITANFIGQTYLIK